MHDGNPEIEATLGVHENPIHESTINEHHKPWENAKKFNNL